MNILKQNEEKINGILETFDRNSNEKLNAPVKIVMVILVFQTSSL